MEALIVERKILPEPIFSCIQSERVRVFQENGNVVLSPVGNRPNANELFGMFSDGKLSTEGFIRQKAVEKEIEN